MRVQGHSPEFRHHSAYRVGSGGRLNSPGLQVLWQTQDEQPDIFFEPESHYGDGRPLLDVIGQIAWRAKIAGLDDQGRYLLQTGFASLQLELPPQAQPVLDDLGLIVHQLKELGFVQQVVGI
jgi:hypothetical protein